MIQTLAQYAGYIAGIATALAICVKPIREKLFGIKVLKEAMLCSLRNDMLEIYKAHENDKSLDEDEYHNFEHFFNAYKELGGNSFILRIWNEIKTEWTLTVK